MIDPKVHGIISDAVFSLIGDADSANDAANAVIGALAVNGFAIVEVDADVVRRVLAEMSKKS